MIKVTNSKVFYEFFLFWCETFANVETEKKNPFQFLIITMLKISNIKRFNINFTKMKLSVQNVSYLQNLEVLEDARKFCLCPVNWEVKAQLLIIIWSWVIGEGVQLFRMDLIILIFCFKVSFIIIYLDNSHFHMAITNILAKNESMEETWRPCLWLQWVIVLSLSDFANFSPFWPHIIGSTCHIGLSFLSFIIIMRISDF